MKAGRAKVDMPEIVPLWPLPSSARTSFIGRARELDEVAARFAVGSRLVTLVGAPGMGKTRLAQELAARRADRVTFVDLTAARSLGDIAALVGRELGAIEGSGRDPIGKLGERIAHLGSSLVVLDNFEQIVEHAANTVGRWIDAAPAAHFLVTSREHLGLAGESLLPLEPLAEDEALALFEDRSRALDASFRLAPERATAAMILACLDRMPLAIELAASRVRVLGMHGLLARVSSSMDLLRTSRRDVSDRQATLAAAIEWSWQLLSPIEQRVLAQCSVFEGSFSLEAAEAVVALEANHAAVLDILQSLHDKSLIGTTHVRGPLGEVRFKLLESIRAFARERLRELGVHGPTLARHGAFYFRLAVTWGPKVDGPEAFAVTTRLDAELANLVAVLRPPQRCRPDQVGDMVRALSPYLALRKVRTLALELFELAFAQPSTTDECRMMLLRERGMNNASMGRIADASEDLQTVLAYGRSAADDALTARALYSLGFLERSHRPLDADEYMAEAGELARRAGDFYRLGLALLGRASIASACGDFGVAEANYASALDCCRTHGLKRLEGYVLVNLGAFEHRRGGARAAETRFEDSARVVAEVIDPFLEANLYLYRGLLHHEAGDLALATSLYEQVPAPALAGSSHESSTASFCRGLLAHEQGDLAAAGDQFQAAIVGFEERNDVSMVNLARAHAAAVAAERGVLGGARCEFQRSYESEASIDGVTTPEHRAIEVLQAFLDLEQMRLAIDAGDMVTANQHLRAIQRELEVEPSTLASPGRMAQRLLRVRSQPLLAVRVNASGAWLRLPTGERYSLEAKPVLRRLLARLLERRLDEPGVPLSVTEIQEAGWPGERLLPQSALDRVYAAIKNLRNAGLRELILTQDAGYLLSPAVPFFTERD